MNDLSLPILVSYGWVWVVFIGSLLLFHICLVWLWPLGKLGWKTVDYLWLTLGIVGVMGSVGIARQDLARRLLSAAEVRLQGQEKLLEDRVRFGTSSAICRTFIRSEASPPPEEFGRTQQEFDAMCTWFQAAQGRFSSGRVPKGRPLTLAELGGVDPPGGADQWAIVSLEESIDRYNETITGLEQLRKDAEQSNLEFLGMVVGPFLVMLAVALRIAKVTGEIRLEKLGTPVRSDR